MEEAISNSKKDNGGKGLPAMTKFRTIYVEDKARTIVKMGRFIS